MGVPSFFRWLTKKYPSVIVHCVEDKVVEIDGVQIPVDSTAPNPNGVEFDNLYLDMNGIIHPCTHPENKPAPKNEDEMMIAIFECIDRLFRIVRPRKLLYMAIDGVAPRAKMNQQRSRRFRATKETSEKLNEIERIREDMAARGCLLPPTKERGEHFDSNCITPGTPFMDRLSKALNYYVHERLNSDPAWKNIKVILSDANAPGEGEHKVMDFIRRQRAQPGHDPNTSHCLCGADADLIMLGLATHEPNFTIIREEFRPNTARPCDICGQNGHEMKDCLGLEKECPEDGPEPPAGSELEFIFVRLNVLREYLLKELEMPNLPFKFDLDRAVDDWVFMCFFVGNDFLPHLPSLEIREGAIDRLVRLYKKCVYKTGGWLTDSGIPNLSRVQVILSELGEMEDEIFRNRQSNDLRWKARQKADKRRRMQDNANCYNKPAFIPGGSFAPTPLGGHVPAPMRDVRNEAYNMRVQGIHTTSDGRIPRSNQDAAAALKAMITNKDASPNSSGNDSAADMDSSLGSSTSSSPGTVSVNSSPVPYEQRAHLKRKLETRGGPDDDDEEEETNDEVRLWEEGFKDRYYESKFDVLPDNVKFRIEVGHQYVRGLCWVLRYYYQGCASWGWYYPYHYAPFASDFINVGDLSTEFENAKPFSPLEQLMSVFPAASRQHVPEPWGELMLDPESPIIDFYPEDFQIDLNGKKFAWQGVALLPFVDEVRLKAILKDHYSKLTDEEVRRNTLGEDRIYVRKGHAGYDFVTGLYENSFDENARVPLDTSFFQGMGGDVRVSKELVPFKGVLESPIPKNPDVVDNEVAVLWYRDLKFAAGHIFPATRLEGAVDPPKVLKPGDLTQEQSRNWRPMIGMTHSNKRASLDMSGHRALNSAVGGHDGGNRGRGSYGGNMPPPNSYDDQRNNRNRGGYDRDARGYNNNNNSGGGGGYNSYTPRGGGNNYGGNGGYQGGYGGNRYDSGSGGYGGNNSGGRGGGYGGYQPRGGGGNYGPSSGQRSSFGFQDRTPPQWNDNNYNNRGGGRGGRQQNPGYFTPGYNSGGGGNNRY